LHTEPLAGHTTLAMNKIVVTLTAATALLSLCACSQESKTKARAAKQPEKPPAIKRAELLGDPLLGNPKANVFSLSKASADYPELSVTTFKAGEGDDKLDMGKIGVFHLVGKLANGKEFQNTRKAGAPQDVIMMEWGGLQGLIIGAMGMKKGEIRQMKIPAELAYGAKGSPMDGVQASATIFLTAELTEIKDELPAEFLVRRIKDGSGDPIRVGQRGSFAYTGVLFDGDRAGEQFDSSSLPGGAPFAMQVGGAGGAIEGWLKGAIGMRLGEKRWLKIPAKMAYGEAGRGEIPPNATLVFEMELVSIDG
jgi:FKBP-type peptidyl-prolyl cis-trans isomerase FkpA